MIVQGGIDLRDHGLSPGQAREQLVVWLFVPRAERRHLLLSEDQITEVHAFVADVDARAGDELGHGVLVFDAERAAQGLEPAGTWYRTPGIRHAVKITLTISRVKVDLTSVPAHPEPWAWRARAALRDEYAGRVPSYLA